VRKLAVVHWAPVEMYPPVMNLIRYFAKANGWEVTVYTTENGYSLPVFSADGVRVVRSANPSNTNRVTASARYLAFYLSASTRLLRNRPQIVLYFEPQSSFPVTIARLFRRFELFIHHHEYHTQAEFRERGMRLARLFHVLEQKHLFPRAHWISHTNSERLELFLADNPSASKESAHVLPNLPPADWPRSKSNAWSLAPPPPLRLVYVGSVSTSDTYIKELVEWVKHQSRASVSLDVYAYNTDAATRQFLESESGETVRFHPGGVSYDDLPNILSGYHTGVILNKARSLNYKHNASNKLFEYLAAGLDVIYPASMLGVRKYSRLDLNPRVIEVDFASKTNLNLKLLSARTHAANEVFDMNADAALGELERDMLAALERRAP
jgi:hypothetical protein